jgi:hypothetical protein
MIKSGRRITLPQLVAAAIVLAATPLSADDDFDAGCGGEYEQECGWVDDIGMPRWLKEIPNGAYWSYVGTSSGSAHASGATWGCYYDEDHPSRKAHINPIPTMEGTFVGHKMGPSVTAGEVHNNS